ncbi:MAG: histidine phosphatase family protein [Ilumatobacteraceae bacterium]
MLIFVRHGRTAANAAGLLQGRTDHPLDELGEQQAVAVAAFVRDAAGGRIDQVISSPLGRARQTAEAFEQPFEVDERWIELSYGVYEGVPHADVPSEVWNMWRIDPWYVPEGGEALAALDARVRLACDEVAPSAIERNVVVVSHVSPMKAAVAWALDVDLAISWRSHLSHASVCRIDMRRHGPVLVSFNETVPVR